MRKVKRIRKEGEGEGRRKWKVQREIQRGKNLIGEMDKSYRNCNEGRLTLLEKMDPGIHGKGM